MENCSCACHDAVEGRQR